MSIITVHNLSKTYRIHEKPAGFRNTIIDLFARKYIEKKAVNNLSFSIEPGEIVGLLGENGAGKTTTLKMLTGILYPTDGSVNVAGFIPTQRKRAFLKEISFVMGNKSDINWDLPAIDTFRYQQLVYNVPDKDYRENLDFLSELLGVTHLLNTQIRRLSLGERMKMELINSFLYSPELIFLDEPTIGLDVIAKAKIREFIQKTNKTGTTFILTTHDLEDVKQLADQVIIINHGVKVFDDTLHSLQLSLGTKKVVEIVMEKPFDMEEIITQIYKGKV